MEWTRKLKKKIKKAKKKALKKKRDVILESIDKAIDAEIRHYNKLGPDDIFDVQVKNEHLDRLEDLYKLRDRHLHDKRTKSEHRTELGKVIIPVLLSTVAGGILTAWFWYKENVKDEILTGAVAKEFPRVILNQIFKKH